MVGLQATKQSIKYINRNVAAKQSAAKNKLYLFVFTQTTHTVIHIKTFQPTASTLGAVLEALQHNSIRI